MIHQNGKYYLAQKKHERCHGVIPWILSKGVSIRNHLFGNLAIAYAAETIVFFILLGAHASLDGIPNSATARLASLQGVH